MIKRAFKFGLFSLAGAALMGCSNGTAQGQGENVSKTAQTPPSTEVRTVTSKTISFDNNTSCIQKDAGDEVSLTLTDGTELALPRSWLQSVELQDEKANNMTSALSAVSQIRFNLPAGEIMDGCQETVGAHIFPTEIAAAFKLLGLNFTEYSPFEPSFSPIYSFAKVSNSDGKKYFDKLDVKYGLSNKVTVQTFYNIRERPAKYRERWTKEQSERAASMRVDGPVFAVTDVGRVCQKQNSKCLYFDIQKVPFPKNKPLWFVHFYNKVGKEFTLQASKGWGHSIESSTLFSQSEGRSKIVDAMITTMNKLSVRK